MVAHHLKRTIYFCQKKIKLPKLKYYSTKRLLHFDELYNLIDLTLLWKVNSSYVMVQIDYFKPFYTFF